jgi:eukaryotic-like serine/threonine-protein kinase
VSEREETVHRGAELPDSIGRYRIVRIIGRGGMGVVYEGRDDRLDRSVAIKTVLDKSDPALGERFCREGRSAAAVSHPNICQIFEVGDHEGVPYLAMELLEGRSLADRLEGTPLPLGEALPIGLSILSALEALHARGIVHRDLKPSNVFLTPHGVKLLDFGIARPAAGHQGTTLLTMAGQAVGTPRYMAPEQARGEEVDARADLFALGALLFELLSGRPAFDGSSVIDVLHAVIHDHPPPLVGSLAIVEADRVIHRALAKSAADRYRSAAAMAQDLRACMARDDISGAALGRATERLIVLPFQVLRTDPEIDFLAFSLPDAITASLAGLESLVVRSSALAARFTGVPLDLRGIATGAGVDAVIAGTLLRVAARVRITVQLIEVPSGTVLWSHTADVPVDDLFQTQDAVSSAVVAALALPLTAAERGRLSRDVPANREAYSLYLRANRLSVSASGWPEAKELYEQAVAIDPAYAPAWARLGRCLRVLGKYGTGETAERHRFEARRAFEHAFEINPELSLTHNLFTFLEVEDGRAPQAVVRLLRLVRERTSDPDLYAGLVHACRYCGLLDASIAAYERAARLDPSSRTSVAHSFLLRGEYERAISADVEDPPYLTMLAMVGQGRTQAALEFFESVQARRSPDAHIAVVLTVLRATVAGRREEGVAAVARLMEFPGFRDPEGWYYWAILCCGMHDHEHGLAFLGRAVDAGFHSVHALQIPAPFDPVRREPAFADLLDRVRAGQSEAERMFADADGPRILGVARAAASSASTGSD